MTYVPGKKNLACESRTVSNGLEIPIAFEA